MEFNVTFYNRILAEKSKNRMLNTQFTLQFGDNSREYLYIYMETSMYFR